MENNLVLFENKSLEVMKGLRDLKKVQNELEAKENQLKKSLQEAMEKYDIKSFSNEYVTISCVKESVSTSIDLKALQIKEPECYDGLLKDYPKETKRNAYVKITIK